MKAGDTIFALSSAPPPGKRCVVRVSGPEACSALDPYVSGGVPRERGARRCEVRLPSGVGAGWAVVPGVVYTYPGPRSYTGEEVVELHVPGSPYVVERLMGLLATGSGARVAEAGEFTARAFMNGRMDLTAAEGVSAAVSAADERQLKAARQLMAGELAGRIRVQTEDLAVLLALVEAGIDFSDEEVSFIGEDGLRGGIGMSMEALGRVLAEGARFGRFSAGGPPTVVLVGRPNSGKSSLVNALLRMTGAPARSVASPVAGSTRDLLWVDLKTPRGVVRLTDTAGLEEGLADLGDGVNGAEGAGGELAEIAASMRRRSLRALEEADIVLLLVGRDDPRPALKLGRGADVTLWTKWDVGGEAGEGWDNAAEGGCLAVSAVSGMNLDRLMERIAALAFGQESGQGLALTARHVGHLKDAQAHLARAMDSVGVGDELTALHLREALDALGCITGQISPDEVLGKVFSTFCIGK